MLDKPASFARENLELSPPSCNDRSIDLLFAVQPSTKARVAAVQAPGYYIPLL